MSGPAADMTVKFLTPVLALITFLIIESAGLACLVGRGDTHPTLWVLGGVALVNIPLARLCFHGFGPIPGFGFQGIALGTALSHCAGGVAVLVFLRRGRAGLKLSLAEMIPDFALIRRLLRISIPAVVDIFSVGVCQLWFLTLVNGLGVVATAAHGIAIRWESLGYLSGQAFATAAAALVGQNLGARRPAEAKRCGWIAWGIGLAAMTAMGAIFYTLAPQMFELFCPEANQRDVIAAGVPLLRLVAFAMPALACIIIFTGALRGAGDTRIPMLLSWIGFLAIRIPLAYFLIYDRVDFGGLGSLRGAIDLGLYGAWLAMFADLLIRGKIVFDPFRRRGLERKTRVKLRALSRFAPRKSNLVRGADIPLCQS